MKKQKTVPYEEVDLEDKIGRSSVPVHEKLRPGAITTSAEDIESSGGVAQPIAGAAGIRELEVIKEGKKHGAQAASKARRKKR